MYILRFCPNGNPDANFWQNVCLRASDINLCKTSWTVWFQRLAASAINFHPHAVGQQSPTINPMVMFAPTETVIILIESICWTIGIFAFANSSTNYMRFGREGQHPIRTQMKISRRNKFELSTWWRNNSQNGWLGTGITDNWLFPPEQLLIKCEDENWTFFCLFRARLSSSRDLKVVFRDCEIEGERNYGHSGVNETWFYHHV